jgi:hypothetical protein
MAQFDVVQSSARQPARLTCCWGGGAQRTGSLSRSQGFLQAFNNTDVAFGRTRTQGANRLLVGRAVVGC